MSETPISLLLPWPPPTPPPPPPPCSPTPHGTAATSSTSSTYPPSAPPPASSSSTAPTTAPSPAPPPSSPSSLPSSTPTVARTPPSSSSSCAPPSSPPLSIPLNLFAPATPAAADAEDFARTTITYIPKGSPLLWAHFVLMILVVVLARLGISFMEEKLRLTRFTDGTNTDQSPSNPVSMFTIMVQGIPKSLASDKVPLEEYFQHKYPGKVYRVIIPFDLCSLESLAARWAKVQNEIPWLEARLDARALVGDSEEEEGNFSNSSSSSSDKCDNEFV